MLSVMEFGAPPPRSRGRKIIAISAVAADCRALKMKFFCAHRIVSTRPIVLVDEQNHQTVSPCPKPTVSIRRVIESIDSKTSKLNCVVAQNHIFTELQAARERFLALIGELRPDLHRYCARMTGSVIDGEDVVQETLARAYYELAELKEMPALRSWLFRIAHNRAIDYLRARARRVSGPLDEAIELPADPSFEPDNAATRGEAVHSALLRFLDLAPAQRSCVILKDVFDYSLDQIAAMLGLTVPAIKAALARGRARLRKQSTPASTDQESDVLSASVSPALMRYAELFNRRDWDSLRAMLVDDVRLELASRFKREGRVDVGSYFTNYDGVAGWRVVPGTLEGREILAVFVNSDDPEPSYFVQLTFSNEQVAAIKDFRYVPYIVREASIELVNETAIHKKKGTI
jgi:RNA polymerase sigma-70 factor (ECF subfamily)